MLGLGWRSCSSVAHVLTPLLFFRRRADEAAAVSCGTCCKVLSAAGPPPFPRDDALLCDRCSFVSCKTCYTSDTPMPSSCPDGTGLTAESTHWAWGGFTCASCVVSVHLGRRPTPLDFAALLCRDLEVQRQLDVWHGRHASTLRGYHSSQLAIRRFGSTIGVNLFPRPSPDDIDADLGVPMAWYVLHGMLSGGRSSVGRSLDTLRSHGAAYTHYFEMYLRAPPPTASQTFRGFMKGAGRRVHHTPSQAFAFTVPLILELQRQLAASVKCDPFSLSLGDARFQSTFEPLLFGSVLLVSFLSTLRGNEPYLLELEQVLDDRVLGVAAVAARCSEHYNFAYIGTKNNFERSMRVPVVGTNRAGILLKCFLEPFLFLRAQLVTPVRSLFVRFDGSTMDSHFFLTTYLRPAFLRLQDSASVGPALRSIRLRAVTTNSLRRGGNTAAANGLVPGFMRRGHGRWRAAKRGQVRLEMVDLYDEVGIERQLSVSYLMCAEATVAKQYGSPTAARRLFGGK